MTYYMIWLHKSSLISGPTWKWWNGCVFQHSQLTIFKIPIQINHMACLAKCESGNWNDVASIRTIPAHYWPIKFQQHRSLNSLNISKQHLAPMSEDYMHIIYDQKQDRFWSGWFRILTAQPVNCAKWFLKVSTRLVTVLLNDWCEI